MDESDPGGARGHNGRSLKLARHLSILVLAGLTLRCSSSVQPTPVIEDPILNCPADVSVIAHNGAMPTVAFDTPLPLKGAPPVTVACRPASGTPFNNGITGVTCEATDSRGHKAGCSFSVVVTPIPQLLKTKFLAFGDSITEGKTRLRAPTIVQVPSGTFNASGSYPEELNARLTARYQDQSITIIAFGKGLEYTGAGQVRLQDHWAEFDADAVMLLEGTNDITDTVADINDAMNGVINGLRSDIIFAKGRGATVFLGTLLPLVPPVRPVPVAAVPTVNDRIKALALEQHVTLVDLNAAIPKEMISTLDGIHPKPGSPVYSLMADEWFKAIVDTMEVKTATATLATRTTAPPQTLLPVRGRR